MNKAKTKAELTLVAYTDASKQMTTLRATLTHRIDFGGVLTFIQNIEEQKTTATNPTCADCAVSIFIVQ